MPGPNVLTLELSSFASVFSRNFGSPVATKLDDGEFVGFFLFSIFLLVSQQ